MSSAAAGCRGWIPAKPEKGAARLSQTVLAEGGQFGSPHNELLGGRRLMERRSAALGRGSEVPSKAFGERTRAWRPVRSLSGQSSFLVQRRKERNLTNLNPTDDGQLATAETGSSAKDRERRLRQLGQIRWIWQLENSGQRAKITALNKEINRLLLVKKTLISKVKAEIEAQRLESS